MDGEITGAVLGVRDDTTSIDIYQGLMEGVTYEMRLNLECLKEAGIEVHELRLFQILIDPAGCSRHHNAPQRAGLGISQGNDFFIQDIRLHLQPYLCPGAAHDCISKERKRDADYYKERRSLEHI